MSTLTFVIVAAVAAFWLMAYIGAPLLVWTAAFGALLIALQLGGAIGATAFAVSAAIYVVGLAIMAMAGGTTALLVSGAFIGIALSFIPLLENITIGGLSQTALKKL